MRKMMKRVGFSNVLVPAGAMLIAACSPSVAAACDTCWGASVATPTTHGITMAMLALIGMTSIVGGGIGAFFLHVRRRSRMLEPGDLIVTETGAIEPKDERN